MAHDLQTSVFDIYVKMMTMQSWREYVESEKCMTYTLETLDYHEIQSLLLTFKGIIMFFHISIK